jgi:hypothetical protein
LPAYKHEIILTFAVRKEISLIILSFRKAGRDSAMLSIVIAIGCMCLCISGVLYGLRVDDHLDGFDETENTCLVNIHHA